MKIDYINTPYFCMKQAFSRSEGNLSDHRGRTITLFVIPLLIIPLVHVLKQEDEVKAILIGAYLLFCSVFTIHTSFLLKVTEGIKDKDRLDTGYRCISVFGYIFGLILLSITVWFGG